MLWNDQPLVINVELAKKLGLNESIVIQQIHYWLEINRKSNRNYIDGKYWAYNTYPEWRKQFPFWSEPTIRRIFKNLEKAGYLITDNFNKKKYDQTKWYTLNYSSLESLLNKPRNIGCDQIDHMDMTKMGVSKRSEWADQSDQNDQTNTKDYPKIKSEITQPCVEIFGKYDIDISYLVYRQPNLFSAYIPDEIAKVAKYLNTKRKEGKIINPIAYLMADPIGIITMILSEKPRQNYANEAEFYVLPDLLIDLEAQVKIDDIS